MLDKEIIQINIDSALRSTSTAAPLHDASMPQVKKTYVCTLR
jgi:hypothetical protein